MTPDREAAVMRALLQRAVIDITPGVTNGAVADLSETLLLSADEAEVLQRLKDATR